MAPRQPTPKPTADDTSSTGTIEVALKPKTKKAKVEKVKAEKPEKTKVDKPKAEKAAKPKMEKVEKGEKVKGEKDGKDGKTRVKAVAGDEAIELILEYLRAQNRPYSATEVSANLHGKVSFQYPHCP
jgi:26S proteasome regulatory subunit (ATPase 3-interacting protein)